MPRLHIFAFLPLFAVLPSAAFAGEKDAELEGMYRLVAATRTVVATGEVKPRFGENPSGYIVYTKDRRMMVVIVNNDGRPKPKPNAVTDADRIALYNSAAAYGGTYSFDGKEVRHNVDISLNNMMTGTTLVRQVRREGNRLIFSSEAVPSPIDGEMSTSELTWERIP